MPPPGAPVLAASADVRTSTSSLPPTKAAMHAVDPALHDAARRDALARFQAEFETSVAAIVRDAALLSARLAHTTTPLRAEYVALCAQHKVRHNSGVVRLLASLGTDGDAVTLSLRNCLISDAGAAPLAPLLARMYRLQAVDLAHNGLQNRGVHVLCAALHGHQALTSLDVSGNAISRAGGKDLLQLVASVRTLTDVNVDDTQIEAALAARIARQCEVNRLAPSVATDSARPRSTSPV